MKWVICLTLLLLTGIAPALASGGTVTRSIPDATAGESLTVSLDIDVGNASYYVIEESIPPGWIHIHRDVIPDGVSGIVDGGIKLTKTSDATDMTYTYTVDVPMGATGPYSFTGSYMMEGGTTEQSIGGDTTTHVMMPAVAVETPSGGGGGGTYPAATPEETPTEAPTGRIYVSSTPSGAYIYLDGAYKGTTPKTLIDVPVGSHTIRLAKSEYEDWSTSVSVTSEAHDRCHHLCLQFLY